MAKEYKELVLEKDKLFDVATSSPDQKAACYKLWGFHMGEKEKVYLEDQRGPRSSSAPR